MDSKNELEEIIILAEQKIEYFNSCIIERFPENFSESVEIAINALLSGQSIPENAEHSISASINIADRILNSLADNFDKDIQDEIIEKYFGFNMLKFFMHDASHLSDTFLDIRNYFSTMLEFGYLNAETAVNPEFYPINLKEINRTSEKIARMYANPWRLLKFSAERKLGRQPKYEPVSIQKHFNDVADVLSLRFCAEVSHNGKITTTLKKSISILGENITIPSDNGLIWSVVYNNLKNSQKKFDEDEDDYFYSINQEFLTKLTAEQKKEALINYLGGLKKERISTAGCYNLNQDYLAIIFSDTGSPIDLNKMITGIRKLMQEDSDLDWVTAGMGERYSAWTRNDYRFNRITMEDVTNAAFIGRVGGSGLSSISSGMGLYGTRHIIESSGGAILYTTTFQDENPVFVYILPKIPTENKIPAQKIREIIIEDGLPIAI